MECALAGQAGFVVNAPIDVQVGGAVFVALVAAVDGQTSTILLDGQVRIGTIVTLTQERMKLVGRVQTCLSLGEGSGFAVEVIPSDKTHMERDGFQWPGNALAHLS